MASKTSFPLHRLFADTLIHFSCIAIRLWNFTMLYWSYCLPYVYNIFDIYLFIYNIFIILIQIKSQDNSFILFSWDILVSEVLIYVIKTILTQQGVLLLSELYKHTVLVLRWLVFLLMCGLINQLENVLNIPWKNILYFFYFTVVCMFYFNSHLFLTIRFKIFSDKFQQCELHFGSWMHHKHEIDIQFFPRRGGNQSANLLACLQGGFILLVFDQYISLLFCTELELANFWQEGHQS